MAWQLTQFSLRKYAMPTISSGDNCIQSVGPEDVTAPASFAFGVDLTAAAVSPPQPMAATSTNARATVRRVTFTIWLRSINGTRISTSTARPGSTTEPTTSSGPLNSFSVWNKNRKYHSGRGMYDVSVGSANCSSGTRTATAIMNRMAKAMKMATVSLKTCCG